MRILSLLLVLVMSSSVVLADNFFESNSPFPTQNYSPKLNNIYETEPAVMQQEEKAAKKSGWWRWGKDDETPEVKAPAANEGVIKDTGFVIIPSNK